ncbi:MAG: hypothetical protein IRZ18_01345, partial [Clostridia bacterium]|nr:hypothetical protein [Clostridia bacterium]
ERVAKLTSWIAAMNAYPLDVLERYQRENPLGGGAVQVKEEPKRARFRLFGR